MQVHVGRVTRAEQKYLFSPLKRGLPDLEVLVSRTQAWLNLLLLWSPGVESTSLDPLILCVQATTSQERLMREGALSSKLIGSCDLGHQLLQTPLPHATFPDASQITNA